jgi:serine/threonine protein kinase
MRFGDPIALKLIKGGMNTREFISRFESERQALALMDHPAIARVFEAGSTPDNRPYFPIEYVAGKPITAYCDDRRLTLGVRLELFIRGVGVRMTDCCTAAMSNERKPSGWSCKHAWRNAL